MTTTPPHDLTRSHRAWIKAVNETDLEAYADVVCRDLVWLPPGQDAVEGRAAFRRWLAPFFEQYDYRFSVTDSVFRIAGRWAVEKGRFRSVMTPVAGDATREHSGRFITLWRRDDDGVWRIERYVDDS